MKQIDRLLIKELVGPWAFGVAMFTVLIVAASYLFKLSDYLVQGVPLVTVLELSALWIPGVMVKTFPMAMLLSGLLGFGRLSGDSEIVALRAAGASMYRLVAPVGVMALVVAGLAFTVDESLVPWSAYKTVGITEEIAKKLDPSAFHITSLPITEHGKTVGAVVARNFDSVRQVLVGATVIAYDQDGRDSVYLEANELKFDPTSFQSGGGWQIQNGARMTWADGRQVVTFLPNQRNAWPKEVPQFKQKPQNILAASVNNLDVWSMGQIREHINEMKQDPATQKSDINNLEFGYWNKIALPLATFVYGIMGAPLGIRRNRTTAASGFALAVAIIFGYVNIINLLNVYAKGGVIPPIIASFTPLVIGFIAALIIIQKRNI